MRLDDPVTEPSSSLVFDTEEDGDAVFGVRLELVEPGTSTVMYDNETEMPVTRDHRPRHAAKQC